MGSNLFTYMVVVIIGVDVATLHSYGRRLRLALFIFKWCDFWAF